jgi:hypothetical protein
MSFLAKAVFRLAKALQFTERSIEVPYPGLSDATRGCRLPYSCGASLFLCCFRGEEERRELAPPTLSACPVGPIVSFFSEVH